MEKCFTFNTEGVLMVRSTVTQKNSPYLPSLKCMRPDSIIIYYISNSDKYWTLDSMLDEKSTRHQAAHLYIDEYSEIFQLSPLNIKLPLSNNPQNKNAIGITIKLSCVPMDNEQKNIKSRQKKTINNIISCLQDTYSIPISHVWQYVDVGICTPEKTSAPYVLEKDYYFSSLAPNEYYVKTHLNLRAGIGKSFIILEILPQGEKVKRLAVGFNGADNSKWVMVQYKENIGWVNNAYLTKD